MVTRSISQRELRNDSGEILRRVDEGESFVVTRNGTPVAALSPLRRQPFVASEVLLAAFRAAPHVDGVQLRNDLDHLADPSAMPHG